MSNQTCSGNGEERKYSRRVAEVTKTMIIKAHRTEGKQDRKQTIRKGRRRYYGYLGGTWQCEDITYYKYCEMSLQEYGSRYK
jgi:hypothetical protein